MYSTDILILVSTILLSHTLASYFHDYIIALIN